MAGTQTLAQQLKLDAVTGVWRSPGPIAPPVTVRMQADENLLKLLRGCKDLSTGSTELANGVTSSTMRYHVSVRRADLLRPLRPYLTGRVLEIAASCGALTRFLGETAREVVALEDNLSQAVMARQRCRGQNNVAVVAAHFGALAEMDGADADHPAVGTFDAICAVDTFNVRPFAGKDPIHSWLVACGRRLAPNGRLVMGLDNRLGAKFLAGAPDIYTNTPFASINELRFDAAELMLGRGELLDRLHAAGFAEVEFLFPFPCHRFPSVVVTERGAAHRGYLLQNLAARLASMPEVPHASRSFSEELFLQHAAKNGALPQHANSLLLVAHKQAQTPAKASASDAGVLAYVYSTERAQPFAKETIVHEQAGAVQVTRNRLYPARQPRQGLLQMDLCEQPYVDAPCYLNALQAIVNRAGWTVQQVADWAQPWLAMLQALQVPTPPNAPAETRELRHVPGAYVDLCPLNLLVQDNGALLAFDQEWKVGKPVPLAWVLQRGLYNALLANNTVAAPHPEVSRNVMGLILQVVRLLGEPLSPSQLHAVLRLENRHFWSDVQFLLGSRLHVRGEAGGHAPPVPAQRAAHKAAPLN